MTDIFMNKEVIQRMDRRTKCSVYGYIRRHSDYLLDENQNHPFYNIPELVTYICLSYFYSVEFFQKHQNGTVLSMNKKIAKSVQENEWSSVYGRHRIDSMTNCHCLWDIRMTLQKSWYILGITTNTTDTDIAFQRNKDDINYAYYFQADQALFKYQSKDYGDFSNFKSCKEIVITMDLNLKKGTLAFYVKNHKGWLKHKKYQGIMYDHVSRDSDVKYSMAISLYGKNATATIENYRVCTN